MFNYDSTDPLVGFPCWQDKATETYLNLPEVKNALNIADFVKGKYWTDCK